MFTARFVRLAVVVLTLFTSQTVRAIEPWSDAKLTATSGLELWLDASREAAAREAAGLSKLKSGDRLTEWHDASGAKRHATQGDPKKQPKFVQVGSADAATSSPNAGWVVRFDGENDHLRALGVNRKLTDFTLFLIAAPHSNFGDFRGLLAFNQTDRRDYETGFTLDLNAPGSPALQDLNLEGRGFGGARNLMKTAVPFGTVHVIECVADSKQKQVGLAFDGQAAGTREFSPAELIADDITIGARFYTNGPGAQEVRGFLHGDIAEVLLFNKVLSADETKPVRAYLDQKHAHLKEALPRDLKLAAAAANSEPLVTVTDPPPIQMLVPGFSVYELPVDLPNINNIRSRADGKLYALGYNGNIWLLSDSDGDGFEDKADRFFDSQPKGGGVPALRGPIGMHVIPNGHPVLRRDLKGPAPWMKGIAKPNDDDDDGSKPKAPLTLTLSPEDGGEGTGSKAAGVIVASKGKVSAIIDYDGDGKADEEKIIATGWKEIPQNVDAVGIVIGHQGEIYFGLGTAAYNNAYLIDESGKAQFDIESERGTIQRILPDLSRRETVCTGVRFPIGLAVNGICVGGDNYECLFASDQEGATWLPNGNPFDELLYILPGKHYGFPPRHPKHLPNVVDEPSLFDYGPQHQSTCGMAFNRPRPFSYAGSSERTKRWDWNLFGPEEWAEDLFVTGESRGKLYRTQLKMNKGQYVARNHLIACLSMLTVDCCLSPKGDLIVACHSGGPDWGTGPTGRGKLFVIRCTDKKAPQPIATWTAGPQEVRVAFDRPLDPAHLKSLTAQTKITCGEFVAAGDRFETLRPGYAVVQRQMASPRCNLPVHGVSVTPDRRTLVIATAPHRAAVQYALTLPGLGRAEGQGLTGKGQDKGAEGDDSVARPSALVPQPLPQHPQIDLAYSLNGVLATWEPEDKTLRGWSGVLPHLDLNVCNEFSTEDAEDERFREILNQEGTLTLETQLDLRNLLHPASQPGSKLDHEWPSEEIHILVEGSGVKSSPIQVFVDGVLKGFDKVTIQKGDDGRNVASVERVPVTLAPDKSPLVRIKVVVGTEDGLPIDSVSWWSGSTDPAPLALSRFLVPWADLTASGTDDKVLIRDTPELAEGSWGRGRRVFFSEEAGCAKCHVAHGTGGAVGADLSNLIHRDYTSVLRDITQPSFAINPDFISYGATLKDGRVLTGAVRSDGDNLLIGDKEGKVTSVARADIDELQPSPISIMPEGLPKKLGDRRMKDLLTFLLTEPPHMPQESPLPPPKPRTRREVAKVLAGSAVDSSSLSGGRQPPGSGIEREKDVQATNNAKPGDSRPLHILLVAGAKDHGPGEHDYPAWLRAWSELLRGADGLTVETAMEWPSPEQIAAADTIAFFQKGSWNAERAKAIDAHLARGGGLVYIHWAVEAGAEAPAFAQRIGLASNASKLKYRHGPLDLGFDTGQDHPIGRNFDQVHFHDESYWLMQGDPSKIKLIASGIEDREPRPLFWTFEPPRGGPIRNDDGLKSGSGSRDGRPGRVFVSILGHYSWTFDDPLFRILLLRGMAWTANEPVDRFNELATIGVKLAE